jgi:3-hydroxybutyryl-CoA dehydrogenase
VAPAPQQDPALAQRIVDRVLAMLVNEAVDAVHLQLASVEDIELAMTTGVNYPRGLLQWGDDIGAPNVLAQLQVLQSDTGDDRYRPSIRLRRAVQAGASLLDARRYS